MWRRLSIYAHYKKPTVQMFYTRADEDYPMMALYLPYKAIGIPSSTYCTPTAQRKVEVSKLSNGIRVATLGTQGSPSPVVSYGVYVKSGSRHETRDVTGVTHLLKQMAFKTNKYRFDYKMVRGIEELGANLTVSAGREYISYTSEVPFYDAGRLPTLLNEIWRGPQFLEFEMDRQLPHLETEVADLKADGQTMVMELLHRGAFRGHGLGNSLIGSPHHLEQFTTGSYGNAVKEYVKTFYTPENTTIVGLGVDHQQFLEWVKPSFERAPVVHVPERIAIDGAYDGPVFEEEDTTPPTRKFNLEPSKYVGGEASDLGHGHDHSSYVAIAFEGVSAKDEKDGVVLEVVKYLLGGARKGASAGSGTRYSRLGANVVGPNHWVDEAIAFNIRYTDTGLFGVYAKSGHESSTKLVNTLAKEIANLSKGVKEEELTRAKSCYKNDLFENRANTLQFLGQQAFSGSEKLYTPEEYRGIIDHVTSEDVTRVLKKVLSSSPTVAAVGDISGLPSPSDIKSMIGSK